MIIIFDLLTYFRLQAVDDEEFDTESEDESDSKEPSVGNSINQYIYLILLIQFWHSTSINFRLSYRFRALFLSFYGCCHPCFYYLDSQAPVISGDEKNALRKEFVNAAYQTFLAG